MDSPGSWIGFTETDTDAETPRHVGALTSL